MHQTPSAINVPHLHVCTFNVKREHELSIVQPAIMLMSSQNSYFLVTTLLSPFLSSGQHLRCHIAHPCTHIFQRRSFFCTRTHTDSVHHSHQWYTPTNLTFNGHSLTILQTHACIYAALSYTGAMLCVKWQDPDGSHLVIGSCDGFGQTTHTHMRKHTSTHTCMHTQRWRPTECGE